MPPEVRPSTRYWQQRKGRDTEVCIERLARNYANVECMRLTCSKSCKDGKRCHGESIATRLRATFRARGSQARAAAIEERRQTMAQTQQSDLEAEEKTPDEQQRMRAPAGDVAPRRRQRMEGWSRQRKRKHTAMDAGSNEMDANDGETTSPIHAASDAASHADRFSDDGHDFPTDVTDREAPRDRAATADRVVGYALGMGSSTPRSLGASLGSEASSSPVISALSPRSDRPRSPNLLTDIFDGLEDAEDDIAPEREERRVSWHADVVEKSRKRPRNRYARFSKKSGRPS